VSGCCENLIAEAGDIMGAQRKRDVRRWKPLPNNGIKDVTVETSVCVIVNCKV
jgi:hypothetical protein